MGEIKSDLELPGVWATLVVGPLRRYLLFGPHVWSVRVVVPGPDMRYNPGVTTYDGRSLRRLATNIERALAKIQALPKADLAGSFTHPVSAQISVHVRDGVAYVRYTASTNTRVFWRDWSVEQARGVVNTIWGVPDRALELSETLSTLAR